MSAQRIDKFLWCIRVYKTRSNATEACREGRVFIGDDEVKAARELKIGDIILVRKGSIKYKYKVLAFPKSRLGAKLLEQYVVDMTDPAELERLQMMLLAQKDQQWFGLGRPTKKNRRDLDRFTE
jgi:ribosome-associated heat shock protein Hsp15